MFGRKRIKSGSQDAFKSTVIPTYNFKPVLCFGDVSLRTVRYFGPCRGKYKSQKNIQSDILEDNLWSFDVKVFPN